MAQYHLCVALEAGGFREGTLQSVLRYQTDPCFRRVLFLHRTSLHVSLNRLVLCFPLLVRFCRFHTTIFYYSLLLLLRARISPIRPLRRRIARRGRSFLRRSRPRTKFPTWPPRRIPTLHHALRAARRVASGRRVVKNGGQKEKNSLQYLNEEEGVVEVKKKEEEKTKKDYE